MATPIAACSRCGSARVYPKIWIQGFLPTVNAERQVYVCRDCGNEGILLTFTSESEWQAFRDERQASAKASGEEAPRKSDAIPILVIDSVPALEVRGIAVIPIPRPRVVNVSWSNGKLGRGAYRASVDEYWEAVGGARYSAERLYVMDLSGIERGRPDFDVLRFLAKRAELLLDIGARRPEDVMDAFMVDAEAVVLGTKTLPSLEKFREAYDLSEGILPCIDVAGGVLWQEGSKEDRDVRRVAEALLGFGYSRLAVMDLPRLGTFSGPDPALVGACASLKTEVFLGGGVREEDVPRLKEAGLAGGLVEPFTPVIRDLLPPTREEPTAAEAAPSPEPKPEARRTPAPG